MDGNIEKMQSLTGRIKGLGIDKTLTKKGMCAEAKATGEALAKKVNISDIVDDLTSVADDKPLSANQGRILKKQIDEIDPHYAENVIYDDTNVKDAIDKLSKAENIAYDEEKSVQGAIDEVSENVADVQTQIDDRYSNNIPNLTFPFTAPESGILTYCVAIGKATEGRCGCQLCVELASGGLRFHHCQGYCGEWSAVSFSIPLAKGDKVGVIDGSFVDTSGTLQDRCYFTY